MKSFKPKAKQFKPKFTYYKDDLILIEFYNQEHKRIRIKSGTEDMSEAIELANKRIESEKSKASTDPQDLTLSEAFSKMYKQEWHEQKDAKKRKQTANLILEYFTDTKLSEITANDINDYCIHLRDEHDNSNATINRKLAVIKRTLNVAMKQWGVIDTVPYIKTFKEQRGGHRTYITQEQFDTVLSCVSCDKYRLLLELLYESGLRPSEALSIKVKHIDFNNKSIELHDTKNSESYMTALSDKAFSVIQKALEIYTNSDVLFDDLNQDTLRKHWNKGRRKLDKADDSSFVVYALRHTFARRMLKNNFSTAQVKAMLHHKTIITTESYTHLESNEIYELRDKINGFK